MEAHLSLLIAADILQRKADETCSKHGLTAPQYNVLRILRGVYPDGHARCDIIERMVQQAPDVTRLIDRLAKNGLVKRGRSKVDARLSLTFITSKGLKLLDVITPEIEQLEAFLKQKLAAKDARQLAALCEKLFVDEKRLP